MDARDILPLCLRFALSPLLIKPVLRKFKTRSQTQERYKVSGNFQSKMPGTVVSLIDSKYWFICDGSIVHSVYNSKVPEHF